MEAARARQLNTTNAKTTMTLFTPSLQSQRNRSLFILLLIISSISPLLLTIIFDKQMMRDWLPALPQHNIAF
jgi:hypothetical protein